MIDIDQGHLCRRQFPRDAGTFELKNRARQKSFHGVLDIILHAAKKISTMQTMLGYVGLSNQSNPAVVTVSEIIGLDIPPPIVSKLAIVLN